MQPLVTAGFLDVEQMYHARVTAIAALHQLELAALQQLLNHLQQGRQSRLISDSAFLTYSCS